MQELTKEQATLLDEYNKVILDVIKIKKELGLPTIEEVKEIGKIKKYKNNFKSGK
jgi:hypothetical protein